MPRQPAGRRPPPEPREGFVAVGFVRGPRGLAGELKVDPLTDNPTRFSSGSDVWTGGRVYTVESARMHQGVLLLHLRGISSREAADRLQGALLEVPEAELAPLTEGEYYRYQLLGMAVRDTEGRPLGSLEEVLDTGANDVYVVRGGGRELLIPALDSVIERVDVEGRAMVVRLIEGMAARPLPSGSKSPKASRRGARRGRGRGKAGGSAPGSPPPA